MPCLSVEAGKDDLIVSRAWKKKGFGTNVSTFITEKSCLFGSNEVRMLNGRDKKKEHHYLSFI